MSANIDASVLASLAMVLVLSNREGNRALISFDRNADAAVLGNALYHHLVSPLGGLNALAFPLAPVNPIPPPRYLQDIGEKALLQEVWEAFFRFVHDHRPHAEFAPLHQYLEDVMRTCYFTTRVESECSILYARPSSPSTEYEVRALDGYRVHRGRLQYFVLYQGYSHNEGTWEDRRELLGTCPVFVRQADRLRLRHPHAKEREPLAPHRKRKRNQSDEPEHPSLA